MTIQPSILIWTLISFCLLMLILDRLLFRPMLAFMDKRQARIDAAMQKKADNERAIAEAEAEIAARRKIADARCAEMAANEIKDAKVRAEGIIAKAKNEREKKIKQCKDELTECSRDLRCGLDAGVDRLARAFVDKLVL